MIATTGTNAVTVNILPNGETHLSSNDPWYRLFKALADLFIAGEVRADYLTGELVGMTDDMDSFDEAGRQLYGHMLGVLYEPPCVCWAYQDGPPCIRNCVIATEDDYRAHMRETIYGY